MMLLGHIFVAIGDITLSEQQVYGLSNGFVYMLLV
jgi:hypothetical protein